MTRHERIQQPPPGGAVREALDFSQPVALMLLAVLHFFPDDEDPAGIVATLLDALPGGSYLVASHATADYADPDAAGEGVQSMHRAGIPFQVRTAAEVTAVAFGGLGLVPPGLVPVSQWRREPGRPCPLPAEVGYYGAMGRKP